MAHYICGFVALRSVLAAVPPFTSASTIAPLEGGFGLLLDPACPSLSHADLAEDAARFGLAASQAGAVAYVATDYFGGRGEQAAAAWRHGTLILAHQVAEHGVINAALRAIGFADKGQAVDEFEAIGLAWFRDCGDWISFAELGHANRPWETESGAFKAGRDYAVWLESRKDQT